MVHCNDLVPQLVNEFEATVNLVRIIWPVPAESVAGIDKWDYLEGLQSAIG